MVHRILQQILSRQYQVATYTLGVMLAISFLELIPESIRFSSIMLASFGIIIGSVVMYSIDKIIPHIHPALCKQEQGCHLKKTSVFLIAGMLPLGIALEQTGAAKLIGDGMINLLGNSGPLALSAGLFILASLGSQIMPNPAVAVLLIPIALNTATELSISPYPLMMTIAVSASAAFLTPVGHPANLLVMGPGAYKFSDYLKVGLPLTLIVLLVSLGLMPFIWPY